MFAYGLIKGFPGGASGKEPACQCRRHKKCWFDPWVGKILWRRAWQSTLVFLPGESQGQRSLVCYRVAQGCTQHIWSDTCMGLLMTIFSIMGDIHSHSHLSRMYVCVLQLLRDMAHKMLWPNNIPLFFKKIFYWRVMALQYCVGFCHTSTWISHRCTYFPFLLNLPVIFHSISPL